MSRNDRDKLSPEELETVNGGSIWDDVADFGKDLWKKVKDVIIRTL